MFFFSPLPFFPFFSFVCARLGFLLRPHSIFTLLFCVQELGGFGGDIEIFAVAGKHHTPWHFDAQVGRTD